jgi:hypothetical protein
LSYHAYIAYQLWKGITALGEHAENGSDEYSEYFKQRKFMKEAVIRDMREEIEED